MTRVFLAVLLLTPAHAAPPEDSQEGSASAPQNPDQDEANSPLTSSGSFEGSWYRVDVAQKQLISFRRSKTGAWEARLQWRTGEGLAIDTDWEDATEYEFRGFDGFLNLTIDTGRSNDDRLVIEWERQQDGRRGSHLIERSELVLYRLQDGRKLRWLQEEIARTISISEPLYPSEEAPHESVEQLDLTFLKQSVRLLEWDEIYW